jgi:hypothetical protein
MRVMPYYFQTDYDQMELSDIVVNAGSDFALQGGCINTFAYSSYGK